MKKIKVGVFPHKTKTGMIKYEAYTTWYNPSWTGCCEHVMFAKNGTEAKKLAIKEHKKRCLNDIVEKIKNQKNKGE